MHGSICCIVKKFVDTNHGETAWEAILDRAGLGGLVLSPIGDYPDEAVIALLGAACELLNCDLDDLLQRLGHYAAPELISFAGNMLHPDWRSFEVLANVETLIHRTVRIQNPTAVPANIQAFRLGDDQMQVVYSSRRNLCPLARGILEGMGDYFSEDLTVREVTCTRQGHPFCTFDVSRVPEEKTEKAEEDSDFVVVDSSKANTSIEDQQTCLIGEDPGDQALDSDSFHWLPSRPSALRTGMSGSEARLSQIPFPKRLGRYAIHEIVGVGGMGVVYKATDETLNRLVAIKTLKSLDIPHELVDTFLEEARAMARLNHENVIQVYDVGQIDNRPFFVMEYLTGQTLSQRMAKVKLDISFACYIFLKILDAVNAVHRIGLVHRDIKPDNIMLSLDGKRCHLLDLGLADELCEKRDTKKRLSGTPGYIAPERLKGYPADYRSDFFSLGCVAYELLCGKRAFNRGSTKSIMHSMEVFDQETANWGNVPDALRQLVIQMLNYDRSERATDYAEISRIVEKVMDDQRGEPAVTPDS